MLCVILETKMKCSKLDLRTKVDDEHLERANFFFSLTQRQGLTGTVWS